MSQYRLEQKPVANIVVSFWSFEKCSLHKNAFEIKPVKRCHEEKIILTPASFEAISKYLDRSL